MYVSTFKTRVWLGLLSIHILFLLKIHITLRGIRYFIPTIDGQHKYFPTNYSKLIDNEENEKRTRQAMRIIDSIEIKSTHQLVEARIIASDRQRGYLTQTLGFFMETFKYKETPKIKICNVEKEIFKELQGFTDKFSVVSIRKLEDKRRNLSKLDRSIAKETSDYWQCLATADPFKKYILILEDDALVVPQFDKLLDSLVTQLEDRPEVDYVKMYHPTKLRKIPSIPMTLSISISIVILFQLILFKTIHRIPLVICILVIYIDIRSYSSIFLSDIRFYFTSSSYLSSPESCCTPAVLFRTSSALVMAQKLLKVHSYHGKAKDHILDESRFIGRQTDANYVVHIGSFSKVRNVQVVINSEVGKKDRWIDMLL